MANYSVDIGVSVRAKSLDTFNEKLKNTTKSIDSLKNLLKKFKATASFNELSSALKTANNNVNDAVRGTNTYKKALLEAASAGRALNRELSARARIQARLTNSNSGFSEFSRRATELSGRQLRTQPLRVIRQRRKGLDQFSSPIGPSQAPMAGPQLPPNFNAEIRAAVSASRQVEASVERSASVRRQAAKEINTIELDFNKKFENQQLDSQIKNFNRKQELNKEDFKDLIQKDKDYAKGWEQRFKNRTAARKKANTEVAAQRSKLDKNKRESSFNRNRRLTNIGTGIGFPLLFGGGLGSVAGGAIGGALGGLGGSVFAGALGQQLDKLAAAADKTAQALRNPIDNLSDLVQALGIAGTALEKQIQTADKLGLSVTAALIAQQKFESKFGSETTKVFTGLGKDFTNFNNDLASLGVALQNLIAGPLGGLLKAAGAVARSFSGSAEVESLKTRLSPENRKAFEQELGGSGFKSQKDINELLEKYRGTLDGSKDANKDIQDINQAITDEYNRQQSLLERQTEVVEGQLVNRRDTQAVLQSSVAVLDQQNKLEQINVELSAARKLAESETTKEKIKQLEVDKKQTEEAKKRAEAAQANAKALAERQILQERRALSIQEFQLEQQVDDAATKSLSLRITEVEKYDLLIKQIDQQYQTTIDVLAVQEAVALEGKNELEVRNQITENFKKQNDLAQQRNVNAKIEAIQTEFLRKDRLQAIRDQEKLNELTARNAAIKAIDSNSPERTVSFSGAGLGFFANSALTEANIIRDSAAQLEAYNLQLSMLEKRIARISEVNIKDKRILPLTTQLGDLTQARDLYAQLQPEIDAARIKQQQFNDALAVTAPVVDSLFDGLTAVVAGTKSAEEAFADFLRTISDMLMDTVKQMIAQYIALAVAKSLGMGGNSGFDLGSTPLLAGGGQVGGIGTLGPNFGFAQFANGGPLSANQPSIIGERGPELFIPFQSGRVVSNEMSRASSSQVPFTRNVERVTQAQETAAAMQNAGPIDVRYESQVINNVEYVTAEEYRQGMTQAAERGKALTLSALQNRPAIRSQVGIR